MPLSLLTGKKIQSGIVPSGSFSFLPDDIREEAETSWPCSQRRASEIATSGKMPLDLKRERRVRQEQICKLMKPLSPEQRKVLYLKFIRGWNNKMIARKLKCKEREIPGMIVEAILKINLENGILGLPS